MMGYPNLPKRQVKTKPPYRPDHILQATDLTVITLQNTFHNQLFKPTWKIIKNTLVDNYSINLNTTHAAWDFETCLVFKRTVDKFKQDLYGTPNK